MASATEMYHRALQALAHDAVGEGRLDAADGSAFLDNPLCGDNVEMQVQIEDGKIVRVGHKVRGCLLCKAAASLIGQSAPGATASEIDAVVASVGAFLRTSAPAPVRWEALDHFTPVRGHTSRYSCVELPFRSLSAALKDAAAARP